MSYQSEAPTRGEFEVVWMLLTELPILKPTTLTSPVLFPFGSHLQLHVSCNLICFSGYTAHTT